MVDKPIQIISNLLRYQWDKVRLVQVSSGVSSFFPFPKQCGALNQVPEGFQNGLAGLPDAKQAE